MSNALIPVEVRTVDFYGDVIVGALVQVGAEQRTYVPLRPICTYLGIDWSGQRQRVMRDEVLADEVRFVRITRTNQRGSDPEMLGLPLNYISGWLFGISAQRVRPALQKSLLLYRQECYQALAAVFPAEHFLPVFAESEAASHRYPGFVYLAQNGAFYKIGRSRDAK